MWFYTPLLYPVTPAVTLASIAVSPSTTSLARGQSISFTATATYSDSSTADVTADVAWTSSDDALATVSAGLASGVAPGSVTITATDLDTGISGAAELAITPGTITGETIDALSAGSARVCYVAAIEGYPQLLTSGNVDAAVAAWSDTDYTAALPAYVTGDRGQQITPWEPFQKDGGTMLLRVPPDADDTFGIDVHRREAGAETYLTQTADRNATTLHVKDTSAFASSGTIYIGTECISYSGTTATTFTGCTRGQYSPFLNGQGTNWAEHHRVGTDALGVLLEPVVSEQPRVWIGKWVGIWKHVTDGVAFNAKSDALLVFAGRIASIADDPEKMHTVVEIKSVLASVSDASLGRDMWSAVVQSGFPITAGQTVTLQDTDYVGSWKTANPLVVVASGASGTNEINAGIYQPSEIASAINSWLGAEFAADRVYGTYTLTAAEDTGSGDVRSVLHWRIPSTEPEAQFKMDWPWGGIFGNLEYNNGTQVGYVPRDADTDNAETSPNTPQSSALFTYIYGQSGVTCNVERASGHFLDQYAALPASIKQILPPGGGGVQWGVFLFNNQTLFVGSFVDGDTTIGNMQKVDAAVLGVSLDVAQLLAETIGAGDPLPPIRQVFLIEDTLANILKYTFYGSGADGHNSADWDSLGYGLGIGIPGELLGDEFEDSCDALPGADSTIVIILDKTTKLVQMLGGDEVLRLAFLRWKLSHLEFKTWVTPTAEVAIATLDESNKAEPAGNVVNHRSASLEDTELTRDIVKIQYNRDFTATSEGEYHDTITLEDRVSVDDSGGEGQLVTIMARNTFPQFTQTGTGVEAIAPLFLASMPLFSRPKRKVTRSIDSRYFETITVGDVVLVSDPFARDPATGRRGIAARPAFITRHRCDYGGLDGSGATTDMGGEVDVYFLDLSRIAPYVPCAQVDETADNGGYDDTNHTLTVYAHQHSRPLLSNADATHFAADYEVLIVEIDPADPTAPDSWSRTLTDVAGNVLTLDSALSSPDWDSSKRYRVIFDHFTADETAQQAKAFQADASTASIESSGAPYQYGIGQGALFTRNGVADKAELHADIAYGDGKPRDVGYERGLVRTLNALMDYRTAHSAPMLSSTILENTTYSTGSGYQLQAIRPVFVGGDKWPVNQTRYLRVAPWFRSSTGASATIRVSICPSPTTSTSKNDVTLPTPAVAATWTTTSTTWQAGAATDIDLHMKPAVDGVVWLHIETTIHCQTRLLAECRETSRQ